MTDIFISYSRKDIAFARLLHDALKENGFETWIDWQDIPPSADWLQEVYSAIEQTETFIFILSASSALSEICKLEIDHARKNNKRLIPIVINEVDPRQVHPALAALNWIFSRTEDEFQPAIQSLINAIQMDYEWAKAHTRLQMRALEWERAGNDRSFLLRGADLSQAEDWISVAAEKTPEPTLLQTQYIQASRQEETRRQQEQLAIEQKLRQRQRFALWVVGVGLLVAVGLGLLAWVQRNEAVKQSNIRATAEWKAVGEANSRATAEANAVTEAHSRATAEILAVNEANVRATAQVIAEEQRNTAQTGLISALAMGRASSHYDLALLLAGAAYQKMDTFESRRGLFQVLIANPRLQNFLYGHADAVYDLALSPDGLRAASASADGTFILWDAVQRAPVLDPITVNNSPVISVAFSHDSQLLATGHCTQPNPQTGCDEGKVFLWEAADGQPLGEMEGTVWGSPVSLAFSHNGKLLAAGDFAGQIHLWELSSLQRIGEPFRMETGSLLSLAFSPDDTRLLSAVRSMSYNSNNPVNPVSYNGKFRLWDVSSQTSTEQWADSPGAYLLAVAFGQDGSPLGAFDLGNQINIWNLDRLDVQPDVFYGASGFLSTLVFSPDGSRLASGGCSQFKSNGLSCIQGEARLWDVNRMTRIGTPLLGTANYVTSLAWSADGQQLIGNSSVPGGSNSILMWDFSKDLLSNPSPTLPRAESLASSPDGQWMAFASSNEITLVQFNGEPEIFSTYNNHPTRIESLAFHPNGEMLAVSGKDKAIYFISLPEMSLLGEPLGGQEEAAVALAFLDRGDQLVSVAKSGSLSLWDVEQRTMIQQVLPSADPAPEVLALSPDGQVLAGVFCAESSDGSLELQSGCSDVEIRLWDTRSGELLYEPIQSSALQIKVLAFSADSTVLATAGCGQLYSTFECTQGEVRVYEAATGLSLAQPMTDHTEDIRGLAFSPDGKMLASLSEEKNLILWDTSQWLALGQLDSDAGWNPNSQYLMAFSPDSTHLYAASGGLSDWLVSPQLWKESACRIANRELTQAEWQQYLSFEPYRQTCAQLP